MDLRNSEGVQKRLRALRVAVPTVIPLFVVFYGIQGPMLFGEHYDLNAFRTGWLDARGTVCIRSVAQLRFIQASEIHSVHGNERRYPCDGKQTRASDSSSC
jgi:hypothetical protein